MNFQMTKFDYKLCCSLQPSLKKIRMTIYFKNITNGLYVFYILNTHVKFSINQINLLFNL